MVERKKPGQPKARKKVRDLIYYLHPDSHDICTVCMGQALMDGLYNTQFMMRLYIQHHTVILLCSFHWVSIAVPAALSSTRLLLDYDLMYAISAEEKGYS